MTTETPEWTAEMLDEAIALRQTNPPTRWKVIAYRYNVDPNQLQVTVSRYQASGVIPGRAREAADYAGVERLFRSGIDIKPVAERYGVSPARICAMLDKVGLDAGARKKVRQGWPK